MITHKKNNKPKISILCQTYNHNKFIEQALDSLLNQKTDFEFEILIHDDASTDGTQDVLKKYKKLYPSKIKIYYQQENQFSKGVRGLLMKFLLPKAKGEYIAVCEGDDFFTDANKLQLQANYLDKRPNYALCFHPVRVFFENNEIKESIYPELTDKKNFTLDALLRGNFIQSSSIMYRRQDYSEIPKTDILPGDWYLHLYHARFGKIGFINKIMSAYRRHSGGIWWESLSNYDNFLRTHAISHMMMYCEVFNLFSDKPKYGNLAIDNANIMLRTVISKVGEAEGARVIDSLLANFSDRVRDILVAEGNNYQKKEKELTDLSAEYSSTINFYNEELKKKDKEIEEIIELKERLNKTEHELFLIKSSRVWRARNRVKNIKFFVI